MGICLIYNINRGKKENSGKQFDLLCNKAETGTIEILCMHHPFSRSSLNLGEKISRLQTTVACVFNSKK